MKSIKKFFAAAILVFAMGTLSAQTPPPPNGGNNPTGGGNTPVGGGAPIGSGLTIMLILGVAYGSNKVLQIKKIKNKLR